jgi:hypothetical protein
MDILLIHNGIVAQARDANDLAQAMEFFPDFLCMQNPGGIVAGATYVNGVFTNPPPAPVPPRVISKLAFRRRFTLAERVALDGAPDNVALPDAVRGPLRTMATDLSLAEEIYLDDEGVIAGLALLEQVGLLTTGRALEIRT